MKRPINFISTANALDQNLLNKIHCVKSVQIRSLFWSLFSRIQSECSKIRTGKSSTFGHFSQSEFRGRTDGIKKMILRESLNSKSYGKWSIAIFQFCWWHQKSAASPYQVNFVHKLCHVLSKATRWEFHHHHVCESQDLYWGGSHIIILPHIYYTLERFYAQRIMKIITTRIKILGYMLSTVYKYLRYPKS